MPSYRPGRRLWIVGCLCAASIGAAQNTVVAPHIRNFHEVNEHLFRGAQPTVVGLDELGTLGVKRVIDLRERGSATAFEEKRLKELGIEYINIPLPELSAPPKAQMQTVLQLLISSDTPTFLHCRRGKDRTGTAIACYRIQHDGWDNLRALREARTYGMSSLERSMQHYILQFQPTTTTGILPVIPR